MEHGVSLAGLDNENLDFVKEKAAEMPFDRLGADFEAGLEQDSLLQEDP